MKYFCCDERRRHVVKAQGTLNGLDYVEVIDRDAPSQALRQRTLVLKFLRPPGALGKGNVRILGGERIRDVTIDWVAPAGALPAGESPGLVDGLSPPGEFLIVRTPYYGDFSLYTLRIVTNPADGTPPAGFDPKLAELQFSFKVECESDFDCAAAAPCAPPVPPVPRISYLARDYPTFRRLMLDRMSAIAPAWRERNAADVGVALVELLAYVGDHLAYRQDAIATEAYLGTARRRVSLRRHARLMDYRVHEGCNARVWVRVFVTDDAVPLPRGSTLLTRVPGLPVRIAKDSAEFRDARGRGAEIFETTDDRIFYTAHERIEFYTWGQRECCLPKGTTSATLAGRLPNLEAGDILVFAEELGPLTGRPEDADRTHRWAVRLTSVSPAQDPSGGLFLTPQTGASVDVTEIQWAADDALPFPLCLSALTDEAHGHEYTPGVSAAYGNIVLADHGRTVEGEALGVVPDSRLRYAPAARGTGCTRTTPAEIPPRFRPTLKERPLTHSIPSLCGPAVPAALALASRPHDAQPAVSLESTLAARTEDWTPRADLLASDGGATEFVVEAEHDGTSALRFGDDTHGRRPNAGTAFSATYRVGNGSAGNVGAHAIAHIVTSDVRLAKVDNPQPAAGGTEPEAAEAIRRDVPEAFRVQERAVTPEDYVAATERHESVQRAAATLRWTGSWHSVFVTVDRRDGLDIDADCEEAIRTHLERFRMAGHDLEVDGPRYVPLEVGLFVCVSPDYFRADVRAALMRVFGSGRLADGRPALFHPDNFTFGQRVYLSRLCAAAQDVQGVASVTVQTFQRLHEPSPTPIDDGFIDIGRLEIARLDNDPNFPERGVFDLSLGGGK